MYDYYDYYDAGISTADILSELLDALGTFFNAIAIIIAIYGIVQCLFGYKILKVMLAISGFLTGSMIGAIIGIIASSTMTGKASEVVAGLIFFMIISGIVGAVISYKVYKLGVFLIGFSGVYLVSVLFSLVGTLMSGGDSIAAAFIVSLIPAGVAGWLVVKFTKPIIIIYTALSGAYLAATTLSSVIGGGGFIIFIALCIAGIYHQIKANDGLTESTNRPNNSYNPPLNYDYNRPTSSEEDYRPALKYDYSNPSSDFKTSDRAEYQQQTNDKENNDLPNIID